VALVGPAAAIAEAGAGTARVVKRTAAAAALRAPAD